MRISLALLIFAFHSRIHVLQCNYGLLNGFIDMGAIAMTGFFLLSGYALHLSYGKKDMSDIPSIRKFYIKRLIAILPLYYTWAIIKVILHIFEKGTAAAIEETVLLPVESLGMQSWFATLFPFFSQQWKLVYFLHYGLLFRISVIRPSYPPFEAGKQKGSDCDIECRSSVQSFCTTLF